MNLKKVPIDFLPEELWPWLGALTFGKDKDASAAAFRKTWEARKKGASVYRAATPPDPPHEHWLLVCVGERRETVEGILRIAGGEPYEMEGDAARAIVLHRVREALALGASGDEERLRSGIGEHLKADGSTVGGVEDVEPHEERD